MPLIIPKTLPAYDALYEENVFVMHRERALAQHIRPLEILILNLMPTKIATETQIARLLANTPLQVHMTCCRRPAMRPPMFLQPIWRRFIRPLRRSKITATTA